MPLITTPFNGLFSKTTWVSWYTRRVKPVWIKMRQEMIGFVASAGLYTNNLHLIPDR